MIIILFPEPEAHPPADQSFRLTVEIASHIILKGATLFFNYFPLFFWSSSTSVSTSVSSSVSSSVGTVARTVASTSVSILIVLLII